MVTREEINFIETIIGRKILDISTECPIETEDQIDKEHLDICDDDYFLTLDNGTVLKLSRYSADLIKTIK